MCVCAASQVVKDYRYVNSHQIVLPIVLLVGVTRKK